MLQIGTLPPVISEIENETTDRFGNVLPTIIITPEAPDTNWKARDFSDAFLSAHSAPASYETDIIQLCEDLDSAGTLSKFLWLAPYVGGNAADHALNLRYPFAKGGQMAQYTGTPTHHDSVNTALEFIQGGSGIYAVCGISLSMLSSTDFSMGLYSLDTAIDTAADIEMYLSSSTGDNSFWLNSHASLGSSCAWSNAAYGNKLQFTPTDASGQFDCVLSGSRKAVFRNGVQLVSDTSNLGFAATQFDNLKYLLSSRRIGMHYVAEHFSDTELANNYTIFQAFHTARGRNV
jgi:hypothetical protein